MEDFHPFSTNDIFWPEAFLENSLHSSRLGEKLHWLLVPHTGADRVAIGYSDTLETTVSDHILYGRGGAYSREVEWRALNPFSALKSRGNFAGRLPGT